MTPNTAPARKPLLKAAAALALGIGALAPLGAAMADEPARIEIRHGDLDLATVAGRAELDRRISAAAERLCRKDAATGTRLVDRSAVRSCIASVRQQVQGRLAINVAPSSFGR